MIHLQVGRFFCPNGDCGRNTFAKQIPGLTARYGRRSIGLSERLRGVALALGGRPGARLADPLTAAMSRVALIRMVRVMFHGANG